MKYSIGYNLKQKQIIMKTLTGNKNKYRSTERDIELRNVIFSFVLRRITFQTISKRKMTLFEPFLRKKY